MNGILRFLALPICGGGAVAAAFNSFGLFFVAGFVLTMLVGWPLLALLEWKFHRYRLRYVFGGLVCSMLAWLLVDGAFFPGAWEKIWTSSYFWTEWAPIRMIFFSLLGLGAGAFYTAIVAAINHQFPPHAESEQSVL